MTIDPRASLQRSVMVYKILNPSARYLGLSAREAQRQMIVEMYHPIPRAHDGEDLDVDI